MNTKRSKICLECGKEFIPYKRKWKVQKFCSEKCRKRFWRKRNSKKIVLGRPEFLKIVKTPQGPRILGALILERQTKRPAYY